MKGALMRQLQATGVTSPGLVQRLLSSATGADSRPAAVLNHNVGVRGMATGADIMCESAKNQGQSPERPTAESKIIDKGAKQPTVGASASAGPVEKLAKEAPHSSKQRWWRPDPVTGTWVPEGYEGEITTSTDVMKSSSRITRIRSEATGSLEDKRWWTSMEELPDMDRADKRA